MRSDGATGVVRHQPLTGTLVVPGQHHNLAQTGHLRQHHFDFARFDAKATDLDLIVVTPQVLDCTIGQPASKIAGLVHPGAGRLAEPIVDEPFSGQAGQIQVTASDLNTGDM